MKFSALASIYAKENPEYLDQSLESLNTQTLQADEIVIVHDGPLTEELYSCLEKWRRHLPLKEIKLGQNRGQAVAFNVGLRQCSYETVAIFDTDDINHPKRFEEQIRYFEKNPDISVLGTWTKSFDKDKDDTKVIFDYPQLHKNIKGYVVNSVNFKVPIIHASIMYFGKKENFIYRRIFK